MNAVLRMPVRVFTAILVGLVRLYQYTLSPLLAPVFGVRCRFSPSCSEYMVGALHKHGPLRGLARGVWRLCRCHPWNPGGYDPP
jgi:hypothetical protein